MGDTSINEDAKVYGVERRLDTVHEAVLRHWPEGVKTITIRGVPMTREQLAARVEAERQIWKRVREAKALIRQFAHDKPEHKKSGTQLLDDVKVGLAAHVGVESETLASWGFHPKRRRRKLTTGEEAIRVAKLRETRRLRGTKGKRQLEGIKFTGPFRINVDAMGKSRVIIDEPDAKNAATPSAEPLAPPVSPPRSVPFTTIPSLPPRPEDVPYSPSITRPSNGSTNGDHAPG